VYGGARARASAREPQRAPFRLKAVRCLLNEAEGKSVDTEAVAVAVIVASKVPHN
jgi:hypothetical protein